MKKIEYDMRILRQVVERAREAKKNKWTKEHLGISNNSNSPGDLYEYHMKYFDILVKEIETLLGGK